MELVAIEETRVIHLVQVHRPAGQLYLPEAAAKVIGRYSFNKTPTLDDLTAARAYVGFGIGKFADSQIQELRVYGDGIIVEARSNSKILDAFVDDLFEWHHKELGLVPTITSKPERYYESTLVVKATKDLTTAMSLPPEIVSGLNQMMEKSQFTARPIVNSGFILDCDSHADGSRRKQERFVLDRRQGVPFEENVFYSQAPLPTDDHLAFLRTIEGLAR